MICLGRSHFFRFNHPAEAHLIKSILPNVRISMPPVSFYPAVDNPEYFHMPAEDGQMSSFGEVPLNDNGPNEDNDSTKPSFPTRKTPPNTLLLPSKFGDLISNSGEEANSTDVSSQTNGYVEKENDCIHSEISPQTPDDISDSDTPPEIPPRSDSSGIPTYVNSSVSCANNYIGEYIYSKAEAEDPKCSESLSEGTSSNSQVGFTKVISPDGATTVHNALYRSIPSTDPLSIPPLPSCQSPLQSQREGVPTCLAFEHVYQHPPPPVSAVPFSTMLISSPSSFYSIPKTPVAVSSFRSPNAAMLQANSAQLCNKSELSRHSHEFSSASHSEALHRSRFNGGNSSCNSFSTPECSDIDSRSDFGNYKSPVSIPLISQNLKGCVASSPNSHNNQTALKPAEAELLHYENRKLKAYEERVKEEVIADAEVLRLEEIINMCAEYERQNSGGGGSSCLSATSASSPQSPGSPSHTLIQNKIKTNGSLPRDKRSPMVSSTCSFLSPASQPVTSNPFTPSGKEGKILFSYENCTDVELSDETCYPPFPNLSPEANAAPPPLSPRSPYENVPVSTSGQPITRSPRTRIKTTFRDKKDRCEVFENKLAAVCEQNLEGRCSKPAPSHPAQDDAPCKLPRSPRIDRRVLEMDDDVIANKAFVDVTPDAKKNSSQNCNVQESPSGVENQSPVVKGNGLCSALHSVDGIHFRDKALADQMIKNINDTLNIKNIASEVVRLKEEQTKVIKETSALKNKIIELEGLEDEALRELELERALIQGELACTQELLAADEEKLSNLLTESDEMEKRHKQDMQRDELAIKECQARLAAAENEIDSVGREKEGTESASNDQNAGDGALNVTADSFQELLESERKNFEDTEFSHMESKASRESEREELNQEISELQQKISVTQSKVKELKEQMNNLSTSIKNDAFSMESKRQNLITRVKKELLHASDVERRLAQFARLGVTLPLSGGRFSPTASSETDESYNSELTERMAKLHFLENSHESNQVKHVSITNHLEMSNGRKTPSKIRENHQIYVAKEGTSIVESFISKNEGVRKASSSEPKSPVEELKKTKEQRDVNCTSLNSVGSDDSTLTSSDLPPESLSSDEINGARNSEESVIKMRQNDSVASPSSNFRPLSEVSSIYDSEGQSVKLRSKSRNQQRPLTQYLPVRTEEHFDLRCHIITAGHQIELCPFVNIDQTSCRGYLHKLGSKFRTWSKRWFVFDRNQRIFVYLRSKSDSKVKGGTYFKAIQDVYVDHLHSAKNNNPKLTFCVKTHDRTFQLLAPSPESMRIWIDVIFTGAEGYREFEGSNSILET